MGENQDDQSKFEIPVGRCLNNVSEESVGKGGSLRRMDKQGVKVDPALLDQAYRNLVNDGERLDQGERNRVSISQTHITLIN